MILFSFPLDNREESDNEDWEARENSRTHSVKFSEDSNADKETPFVRQNTPHPKELKAKAHKLFSKDKKDDDTLFALSEEVRKLTRTKDVAECVLTNASSTVAAHRNVAQQHHRAATWHTKQRDGNCCSNGKSKQCCVAQRRKCKWKKKEALMAWKLILNWI